MGGDHDRGTPRNIEGADYQTYLKVLGNTEEIRVTDFSSGKVVLEGTLFNDPREPQSTLRTSLGPLGYSHTAKYYSGNPLTSSISELYRWLKSVVLDEEYISTLEQLQRVGNPTWNEESTIINLNMGMSEGTKTILDEREREKVVEETRPIIHNIAKDKYELIREPIKSRIFRKSKRHFYGPQEKTEIYVHEENKPEEMVADIERKRYIGGIAPIGAVFGGYASKHKTIEKLLKPIYDVPIITLFNLDSGYRVNVGECGEHVLYESTSDYIRPGQIIGRPKSNVKVYDGAFGFEIIPKFAFWETLQTPNPYFWKRYLWNKKYHGKETGQREKRHAVNSWSVLKEIELRGENGRGRRIKVVDELIYSDPLYRFSKYTPDGEQEIGHIILKREFDESNAIEIKKEKSSITGRDGKRQEIWIDVPYVDTDKVVCEYSINVFLEDDFKKNGPELMNMMLTLCGEVSAKTNMEYSRLEHFDEFSLPTNIDDGLDTILTARNLNEPENWIGKAIMQDLTPLKIYNALKDLFGVEPPEEFLKYIFWDKGKLTPTEREGQMTFQELALRENARKKRERIGHQ